MGSYLPIVCGMRRRAGELLPIEQAILACGIELAAAGEPGFHGFAMAGRLREAGAARQLTAHGTLYKALARLERAGMLASSWEDPEQAVAARRPRRRMYWVTPSGQLAAAPVRDQEAAGPRRRAAGAARRPRSGTAPA
jgi:PadR family transcriptional regulator, regulatory protein PadR